MKRAVFVDLGTWRSAEVKAKGRLMKKAIIAIWMSQVHDVRMYFKESAEVFKKPEVISDLHYGGPNLPEVKPRDSCDS